MTWLWVVEDLDLRVGYAREACPTDFLTILTRLVVNRVIRVLVFVLAPVDMLVQWTGQIFLAIFAAIPLILLLILTGFWFPIWGFLVGTSWLWLKYAWLRPILLVPGLLGALVATVFLMLVPDPKKEPEYITLIQEWPLSWQIYRPSEDYYDSDWSRVGPRRRLQVKY